MQFHRLFTALVMAAGLASSQTFTTLTNFAGANGSGPLTGLIQGTDGNFYGTTAFGGSFTGAFCVLGCGTVFKLSPQGTLTTLHAFTGGDGYQPQGALIQAADGNLYGTTLQGGANLYGTVFKIAPNGTFTSLHSFANTDGARPYAGLIQAQDGRLWGTTTAGGTSGNGTIFGITSGGTLTTMYNFAGTDGRSPIGSLLQGSDGTFFGTTGGGGANGVGTVYQITPGGKLTTLRSFAGADGSGPNGPVVRDSAGNFYGTTQSGGSFAQGNVFKLTPGGVLTSLHSFDNINDGRNPLAGLIRATDGNLYGTTYAGGPKVLGGTVFQITPSGIFTTLHSFSNEQPHAELLQGADGNLYGTTVAGGSSNQGTVFRLTLASATTLPSIDSGGIVPVYSSVSVIQPGSWVSIYGTNLATGIASWSGDFPTSLLGTSVTINGKSAALWFVSPGQINLQAPDDTTIGPVNVVVTTPIGTVTSTVTLSQIAPSLSLLDSTHCAAIISRADGSGSNGAGTYDIVGPAGTSLGYKTVPAKAGDTLVLFGVGFGPTNPVVSSGKAFSGSAPTTNTVQLIINGTAVLPFYSGITGAGLYQFNLVLPAGLGTGDLTLQATVGGVRSPAGVVISLQ